MYVIGVDAHKRVHAAVILDPAGREQGHWRGPNTPTGWQELWTWVDTQTPTTASRTWGIEGARQYGRGLAQQVLAQGDPVVEVNPRWTAGMRRTQRRPDKTDRLDALAVARFVGQEGVHLPQVPVEDATSVLAVLGAERTAAVAEATRLRNQVHAVLAQLPPQPDLTVGKLTTRPAVQAMTVWQSTSSLAIDQARAATVRRLATRLLLVQEQIEELTATIAAEGRQYPALCRLAGVGPLTAGMLAAALGPGRRFTTDAQLARHAGVAPLEASSGERVRHRLNRGGNRQLNAIFERIVLTQARCHPPARAYLARRRAEGKTDREAKRALKRYIARAVWQAWQEETALLTTTPLT